MSSKALSLLALGLLGTILVLWGSRPSGQPLTLSLLSRPEQRSRRANAAIHVTNNEEINQNNEWADELPARRKNIWLVGLMSDASTMTVDTFDFLMDWHCRMGAHVHFLVDNGAAVLSARRSKYMDRNTDCIQAAFHLTAQPDNLVKNFPNRVDRIAHLRDHQRHLLMDLIGSESESVDAVMILDGDLYSVPNPRHVENEMNRMLEGNIVDVLCATGVNHEKNLFGYYDTFATILEPDTWVYPYEHRANPWVRPVMEDPNLVINNGITNVDLLYFIQKEAHLPLSNNPTSAKVLPVKSCFGGMTIYRAQPWLNAPCAYSRDNQVSLAAHTAVNAREYANRDDQRTCEHVVFHKCLATNENQARIALHPFLVTEYHDVVAIYTSGSRSLQANESYSTSTLSYEYNMSYVPAAFASGSNTSYFPAMMSNTSYFPAMMSNTSYFPAMMSNTSYFPSMMSNTSYFPAMMSNSSYYPNMMSNSSALREGDGSMIASSLSTICSCQFQLQLLTDAFGYESTYELIETSSDTVILSGGNFTGETMYYENTCLPTGQYMLYVRDSYGDGIYSPGYYALDICSGNYTRTGGSGELFFVERTVFQVVGSNAYLPPAPQPYQDGTLFARTTSSACAENMKYGDVTEIPTDGAYMCTDCVTDPHSKWMQIFYDMDTELMRIEWQFDSVKTLENRFNDATSVGEEVTWTITETIAPDMVYTREGIWKWSKSSGGWPTDGTGSHFSKDDGVWGASNSIVDGDENSAVPSDFWGQGNFNSADGTCKYYYRDGQKMDLETNALWSQIYAVDETFVQFAPTLPPTNPPTMAPTSVRACQFELILNTDGWGGETSWKLYATDGRDFADIVVAEDTYKKNQLYSYSNCLEPGAYKFTINDKEKDGIFAPGYYDIYLGGVHEKRGGGKGGFTEEESITFTIANDDLF